MNDANHMIQQHVGSSRSVASGLTAARRITHRTRGHGHGPIVRLMSPSDLGDILKPVEWLRAGSGVWHGKELSPVDVSRMQGFQLWVALPPELENSTPESHYIEAQHMRRAGPACVIVGSYEGAQSPVPAMEGVNYLLVTLAAGERWTYRPPAGHTVGWLALTEGTLQAGASVIAAGEMVLFQHGEVPIDLQASDNEAAVFVLGSALPHPHPLHLGYYSVHTSAQALAAGERRIAELGRRLEAAGNRRTASGTVPVFR
jgi:hypothetical protein